MSQGRRASIGSVAMSLDEVHSATRKDLLRWCDTLCNVVDIRDRKWRFSTYENCFVGSQAVESMVNEGLVENEAAALALGNRLLDDGLIAHVKDEKEFVNGVQFYVFRDPVADTRKEKEAKQKHAIDRSNSDPSEAANGSRSNVPADEKSSLEHSVSTTSFASSASRVMNRKKTGTLRAISHLKRHTTNSNVRYLLQAVQDRKKKEQIVDVMKGHRATPRHTSQSHNLSLRFPDDFDVATFLSAVDKLFTQHRVKRSDVQRALGQKTRKRGAGASGSADIPDNEADDADGEHNQELAKAAHVLQVEPRDRTPEQVELLLEVLGEIPFFMRLPIEQRQAAAKAVHLDLYSAGDVVFSAGDRPSEMYIIFSGSVSVTSPVVTGSDFSLTRRVSEWVCMCVCLFLCIYRLCV